MPWALRASATSLSSPAQPPSPDMMMAKVSLAAVPGWAGTSTTGKSPSAAGASGSACFPKRETERGECREDFGHPGAGRRIVAGDPCNATSAAPCMPSMNFAALSPLEPGSWSVWNNTQGLSNRLAGRYRIPAASAGADSSPEPLHSGLRSCVSGENPMVSAAAKVLGGACTRVA